MLDDIGLAQLMMAPSCYHEEDDDEELRESDENGFARLMIPSCALEVGDPTCGHEEESIKLIEQDKSSHEEESVKLLEYGKSSYTKSEDHSDTSTAASTAATNPGT